MEQVESSRSKFTSQLWEIDNLKKNKDPMNPWNPTYQKQSQATDQIPENKTHSLAISRNIVYPPENSPAVSIIIHPDSRSGYVRPNCYIAIRDRNSIVRQGNLPFPQALALFIQELQKSLFVTEIIIRAIRPYEGTEQISQPGDRLNDSEFTQLMLSLKEFASSHRRDIVRFHFTIAESDDPYATPTELEIPYLDAQAPLQCYFEIVPYWMDTLRGVIYRAKGWGYDRWTEAFAKSQLTALEIDISTQPFAELHRVLQGPPSSEGPLQELAIRFFSRSGNFSNQHYDPLVDLVHQLNPTEHFKMDFSNHLSMFTYLFQSLAARTLSQFQCTLRILEFGTACSDVRITRGVAEAFPNLTEIRGILFTPVFLSHIAQWMQEIGTNEATPVPVPEKLLIIGLPAHPDDTTYNKTMRCYYNIKSKHDHDDVKLSLTTPSGCIAPLTTISISQNDRTRKPQRITIIVPRSNVKKKEWS
jgi:hypothetical protein